jgi:hypothetical protein
MDNSEFIRNDTTLIYPCFDTKLEIQILERK